MDNNQRNSEALHRLLGIMDRLRAECPWDKKQTLESLSHLTIEETYELVEAILEADLAAIKEELGDLLLHIVFYAKIGSEHHAFDMADIMNSLCDKLIARHPHVFENSSHTIDEETVKRHWEFLKMKQNPPSQSILAGIPKSLPALIKALRIQEKTSHVGFDWKYKEDVWEKVEEEIGEFRAYFDQTVINQQGAEAELGDLLFSLVNYARFVNINPETALERTNKKVIKRFNYIEKAVRRENKSLEMLTLKEMDAYWDEAKKLEILND